MLREKADAQKVVIFGSLAEKNVRNMQFDIDLSIWGGDWFKAQEIVESCAFKIDVVNYENLPPHIQKRIDTHGRELP